MMQKHIPDHDVEFFVDAESEALSPAPNEIEQPFRLLDNSDQHYYRNAPTEIVDRRSEALFESDRVDPHYCLHAPSPQHYYRNAPVHDESQVSTKSSSSSSVTQHSSQSPGHSPKDSSTLATPNFHRNDGERHPNQAPCYEDEREPVDESHYRDTGCNMVWDYEANAHDATWQGNSPARHAVPEHHLRDRYHHANHHSAFVPIPSHDMPSQGIHHPSYHPNQHHGHHQPSFGHAAYDPRYHGYPQNYETYSQHDAHPHNPSGYYYGDAIGNPPIPDNYRVPQMSGETVTINEQADQTDGNAEAPLRLVGEYNERDILCGRGALMIWHPGNQFFRCLVQTHRQRYFFSRRQEKKKIASQIMHEVKAHGGRFLRRSQTSDGLNEINVWIEIDEERAYQKTCQALREGAPEIRRQWRSKPPSDGTEMAPNREEHVDDAASK